IFCLLLGAKFSFFQLLKGIQSFGKLLANKHRNNSRRRLVGSQSMVVSGRGNSCSQKIGMLMHGHNTVYKKSKKLKVALWRFSRCQKVYTSICAKRPVIVFSATIYTGIRFFVKQHF